MTEAIKLLKTEVEHIYLGEFNPDEPVPTKDFGLQMKVAFSDDDPKQFLIRLDVQLKIGEEKNKELFVSYFSYFESTSEIAKEGQESKFYWINAPAIAYPYLRAFVSNLTLNAGYNTIILPTINFVHYYDQNFGNKKSDDGSNHVLENKL